tara:strand:- start:511 stop:897 length:387 start_codon:yes stop_codon:yes gene_type:complete
MARKVPKVSGLGGVREISRRLKGSDLIFENREAIASELMGIGSASITDIVSWDKEGNVTVKTPDEIPAHALAAIKRIRVINGGLDLEMVDKVRVFQMLAKGSGILDRERESDKPSVVEVTMVGPDGNK